MVPRASESTSQTASQTVQPLYHRHLMTLHRVTTFPSPVCDNFTQNWTGESPVFNPLFILTSLRQLKDMVGTLPQTSMGELRCFPRLPSWLWRGYPLIRTRPQCIWRLNVRSGFLNHLATYSWIMDRHTDRPRYNSNNTLHSCCV